jgi:uncharacterized membrane protein YdjX (TVP38/TMEM64 family)
MGKYFTGVAILALLCAGLAAAFIWDTELESLLVRYVGDPVMSAFVLVALLVVATVIAPVTVLPIIPAASAVLPPFAVGVLSIVGWTIGAVIAFLIARAFGRPLVIRFTNAEELIRYERMIPEHVEFLTLIFLRMLVPVDVLSYAVGILSARLTLLHYTLATAIGVAPFSFIFAYGGAAFWRGEYLGMAGFFVAGVLFYAIIHVVFLRTKNSKNGHMQDKVDEPL